MSDDTTRDFSISKDEARRLVTDAAWERRDGETCGHKGCEDHPRTTAVIHTTLGGIGADWSLAAALEAVEAAQSIHWRLSIFEHDMVVIQADGKPVMFEVRAPRPVRAQLLRQKRLGSGSGLSGHGVESGGGER
jgi:hypothetical protein